MPSVVGTWVDLSVGPCSTAGSPVSDIGDFVVEIGAGSSVGCPGGCMDVGETHPHGHVHPQNPDHMGLRHWHMGMPAVDSKVVAVVV